MNLHNEMILEEYKAKKPMFEKMLEIVQKELRKIVDDNGIYINAIEARIKKEKSLIGKLELKGYKYNSLSDITDILGARVITFYNGEVDKIAALIEKKFDIDWENSVDKRKIHDDDRFGYMSLHYICRIPKEVYTDTEYPEMNEVRFELQMRTALQHVWSNANHDIEYKSDIEVPREYLRSLNRLAGLLEIADNEFDNIRKQLLEYRRRVTALLADEKFDEIELNGDSFKSYLNIKPFKALNDQIASINNAEIQETSELPYLEILKWMGFKTLADLVNLKKEYSDTAYQFALHQVGGTDLDIVSSTIGIQNLVTVYLLKNGWGERGIKTFYDMLYGEKDRNLRSAKRIVEQAKSLAII